MKRRDVLALVAVLAFMFGVSCVFAQEMQGEMQGMPRRQMMRQGGGEMQNPEQMIEKRVEMLTKRYNLTAEQQTKVKEILTASGEEVKKIMQESQSKVKSIMEKNRQSIEALLTDEQKASAKQQGQGGGQGGSEAAPY